MKTGQMATTKNQAVRLGRVNSADGDIYEIDLFGLLVEELEEDTPLKIDSRDSESGDYLRRDE